MKKFTYSAIVTGSSAGGLKTLIKLFSGFPADYPQPIIAVQHLHSEEKTDLTELLNDKFFMKVKTAEEKEPIRAGHIYFAPPDYHLLIEKDNTFSLSFDEKINYSRPSIDVLFESAGYTWGNNLIGIILTGANSDGTQGLRVIKKCGGLTIAQDPEEAEYSFMPQTAINNGVVDLVLTIDKIKRFLSGKATNNNNLVYDRR